MMTKQIMVSTKLHKTWFDLKILFLTVLKVLKRDGINQEGYVTSPEFTGVLDDRKPSSGIG